MNDISTRYNPKEVEDRWYAFWEENNFFKAQPNPQKKPFCIVIPPPNITGILHMGHALNNTIQDILIRYHRMKGQESLWMPGTDHAGIATQNVVEKALAKEGLRRQDLGREEFIKRVWQWRQEYGSTIIRQLKKLGASCDWSRTRFTMDEHYSESVKEVFVRLYEKGLIYRSNYIINWCPRCQTALSDEEAPHQQIQGNLYYLRYPFADDPANHLVVATTRPETMLGDTAVAVNPQDKRYQKFIGRSLTLPLVGRKIKVIADSMVDKEFGTGAVKVTPCHDPKDYVLALKHKLEFVNILNPDGSLNENAGPYKGMDRFQARKKILQELGENGLLEKIEPHHLSAGHCYRCNTIIEPYFSKQWFVRMKPLAQPAISAVEEGKIKFFPWRWTKVYLNWMKNIQDWCISRQIWWGHRLPVYYCQNCLKQESSTSDFKNCTDNVYREKGLIVAREKPQHCPVCGSTDLVQEDDVLDTWFSSWLWPFATFYWPFRCLEDGRKKAAEKDLAYFYPTSVLVTAPEIIFFWVARMIMAGFEFIGKEPFRDVYIHGTVRDIEGKKMSKSLGNIIDPLEIISEYGADALRYSLISITASGQDVFLSKERFEQGRNFANKIWNASRFVITNFKINSEKLDLKLKKDLFTDKVSDIVNLWILSRFNSVVKKISNSLDGYKFNEAAQLSYGFFWHEFCDWYLEMAKYSLEDELTQKVMLVVLEGCLRILHPFMPFITEEVWQKLKGYFPELAAEKSIMLQSWPKLQEEFLDKKLESEMEMVLNLVSSIRNMKAELEIPLQDNLAEVDIYIQEKKEKAFLEKLSPYIKRLTKAGEFLVRDRFQPQKDQYVFLFNNIHIVIPLADSFDGKAFLGRLMQKIEKIETEIQGKERLLADKKFIQRAPAEVVNKEKERLQQLKESLAKLKVVKDGIH